MSLKKVCLLIADINRPGGTERAGVNLANDLNEHGYEVVITSIFSDKGNPFYKTDADVHIQHLGVTFQTNLIKRLLLGFRQLQTALKTLFTNNADTIFIATDPFVSFVMASVFKKNSSNKLVVCEHMALSISKFYSVWLRKTLFKNVSVIVVLTNRDLDFVKKMLPKVQSAAIPNRISFAPETLSDCQSKIILSVGRLEAQKNYGELIRICEPVLKKYSDWRLVIVGNGSQKEELLRLINSLELSSSVTIVPSTQQITDYFMQSGIYVMSSIYEGFPMVLLEAKSYGLPIVSFDCPNGPKEMIVDGKDGYLVDLHDNAMFQKALVKLMDSPALRTRFGKEGSDEVKSRYSKDSIVGKWEKILSNV